MAKPVKIETVSIFPDGHEVFNTVTKYDACFSFDSVAADAVQETGLTTPRDNPQPVEVKVFTLSLEKGQVVRTLVGTFNVRPPLEPLTQAGFHKDMEAVLSDLPQEFRGPVAAWANEHGHSAGFDEVVDLARELANALEPAVAAYTRRVQIEAKKALTK